MEITIERHRWYRGQGGDHVFVKDENGQVFKLRDPQSAISNPKSQCCVFGFGLQQAVQQGKHKDYKSFALEAYDLILDRGGSVINDDPNITDEERERQLTELFARHGHSVKFVN